MRSCVFIKLNLIKMEEFKQEFINVASSEFGIKAIESINFEQAFAILDKMQQLRIHDVVKSFYCQKPTDYKQSLKCKTQ